jgi:hypothetical protein
MAHNSKAGGSRGGRRDNEFWPRSLQLGEAHVLYENNYLVLPNWRAPSGRKISPAGYLVPPVPEGTRLTAYIQWRRSELTPAAWANPAWAENSPFWGHLVAAERDAELERQLGPDGGPYNRFGRRRAWRGLNIDDVLASLGYRATAQPPREHPRRANYILMSPPVNRRAEPEDVKPDAAQRGRTRAKGRTPPPPPQLSPSLDAYLRHQASLCAPDDPEDTPGYTKAVQESVAAEQQRRLSTDDKYCKWWSAYESGAIIDLAESDGPAASGSDWKLSSYDWSKGGDDDGGDGGDDDGGDGGDDDGGDGGDEADSGPRHF